MIAKWLATKPLFLSSTSRRAASMSAPRLRSRDEVDKLAAEGLGILLISSELPELMGMSDRILVMRERRFVAEFESRGF